MALMIPEKPLGQASPETLKVFRALKRIPGEGIECRYDMSLGERVQPEFLVLVEKRHVVLIAVSPISRQAAEEVVEGSLFAQDEQPLDLDSFGTAATSAIREFYDLILAAEGVDADQLQAVRRVIIFPNVPQVLLDRILHLRPVADYQFWGREMVSPDALEAAFRALASTPMESHLLHLLRRSFDPEIVVPKSFQPRVRPSRELDPTLTESLLDVDQELTAKLDLALPDEALDVANELTCRLVTGVAGSGKTLVLLYRAMLCHKLKRDSRILILTHNKALRQDMEERFNRLCPTGRLDWFHFLKWCRQFLGSFVIIPPQQRRDLVESLRSSRRELADLSIDFLLDELDWVMDHGITQKDHYLQVERIGRGRALGERQREAFFLLFADYRQRLDERGQDDWASIPLRVLKALQREQLTLPRYDYVFIDEAQFFAPVWFEVVKHAMGPGAQLFLAADPTQGFLKRRQSWRACGLDVVGRTVRLGKSYRCTRQIYAYASAFYRSRLPEEDDEEGTNLPDEKALVDAANGPEPTWIHAGDNQDELTRIERECLALVEAGGDLAHLLIIHANGAQVMALATRLANTLRSRSRTHTLPRVHSINAVTGLEAPIVFLLGIHDLIEAEGDPRLNAEERHDLIRDNTRRLYMAMTRATQRLVLVGPPGVVAGGDSGTIVPR